MKVPVITTSMPGCKEVVEDGLTGFVVPPKDAQGLAHAMERLLEHRAELSEMGRKAREKVIKEFCLERVFQETRQLYMGLLGPGVLAGTAS
jgi:glycosyltransferase involved in cell wall biosynthesis